MAIVKGQLGAVDVPGTGTLTAIYTVPALKEASINLRIANRTDSETLIRVAHIKNGNVGDVANEDYIAYDISTLKFSEHRAPMKLSGIAMNAGDTIAVYSSAQALSVQANGIEGDQQQ